MCKGVFPSLCALLPTLFLCVTFEYVTLGIYAKKNRGTKRWKSMSPYKMLCIHSMNFDEAKALATVQVVNNPGLSAAQDRCIWQGKLKTGVSRTGRTACCLVEQERWLGAENGSRSISSADRLFLLFGEDLTTWRSLPGHTFQEKNKYFIVQK